MKDSSLLAFLALLSNYEYFRIQQEDKPPFYSTGIDRSCGWVLRFDRKFATPVYSEGELSDVRAVNDNEYDCTIGSYTYHIQTLHMKPARIPHHKHKAWNSIANFASVEYISPDKSRYDSETGCVFLVVDPDSLGELTPIEQAQIKSLINVQLKGCGSGKQVCRTVYYQCDPLDTRQIIYTGMYDLETRKPATKVMAYNTNLAQSMTAAEVKKYSALLELARQYYTAQIA